MACIGTAAAVHHHSLLARLQLVSPPSSPCHSPEPVGLGFSAELPGRLRRRCASCSSPAPCFSPRASHLCLGIGLRAFASAGQEAGTSTLVVQEVDFVWKGEGSEVLLTGDFLSWDTRVALVKGPDGCFHSKQKLLPGTYQYKYVVDGNWLHSPDCSAVSDGKGGFNNEITVADPYKSGASDLKVAGANSTENGPKGPKSASDIEVAGANSTESGPNAPSKPVPPAKPAPKPAGKKATADKPLPAFMSDDVIPALRAKLEKEDGVSSIDLVFQENQLEGSFVKNGVLYSFWAFFPDGKLEGSRGFSLSSYGAPPSTVEPFLIDEKKISADLLVFWIMKRLFAQKMLSIN